MLGASLIVAASMVMQTPTKSAADKLYTSAKAGYSVAMPTGYVERKRQATLAGGAVDFQVVSRKRGGTQLSVAAGDLPSEPTDVDAVLLAARDDVVSQARGKLGDNRAVTLGTIPGREFRFTVPKEVVAGGASGLGRVFVSGRGVYEVVVIQSTSDSIKEPGEAARFVGTFRLNGARATAKALAGARSAPTATGAGAAAGKNVAEIESKEWGYRVRFPGKPEHHESIQRGKYPEQRASFVDGTQVYTVQVTRSPDRITAAQAVELVEAVKASQLDKAKLVSSRGIAGAAAAKEIVATADRPKPGTFVKSRVFATGQFLCIITYLNMLPNGSRGGGDAFLDSFQILSPGPFAPGQ